MTAHGTEAHYVHARCRCAKCRQAAVDARRDRRNQNPDAARAYDRSWKRRWRAARRAVTPEAAVSEPCNCLSYGHGLTLTRVSRRDCPVHGERRDKFAAEAADTREAERLKRERRA